MSREYTQELRTDSTIYLIPATFIMVLLLASAVFIVHYEFSGRGVDTTLFLINVFGSGLISALAWNLARREQQLRAGMALVGPHLLLLIANFHLLWQPGNYIPFFFIYFIAISSTVIQPKASLYIWGLGIGLMIISLWLRGELMWPVLSALGVAWFLGLCVAVGSFLAAVEWSLALEWANSIRSSVIQRRDELFATQEELTKANARQEFLYKQLTASVGVGQQITSILDLDKLLQEVANLIAREFSFDYVALFLLAEEEEVLEVRAQAGKVGKTAVTNPPVPLNAPNALSQAVRESQLVRFNDVRKEPYNRHPYSWVNVCSELILPLSVADVGVLGVLDIQSYHPRAFDRDNIPLLQSLAAQIAIAVRNADLYRHEEERRMLSERLYDIGRALSGTLDRQQVLELILDNLASLLSFDRSAVLLYRDDMMEIVAARGFGDTLDPLGLKIPTNSENGDVFYEVCRTQAPVTLTDALEHPGWQKVDKIEASRSWLGLPLIHRNEVIGMLSLVRFEVRPYTPKEIALASTFANQAAIALQNARLYQRIARFNQELEQKVAERTEALSQAYDRLERLDKAKSDFIEVASHELRTPITVLRGYSDMLLLEESVIANEFQQQLVEGIRSGAIRMHGVVNDMLDVVKIDNENLQIYVAETLMRDVVETAVVKLESALAERRLTLTMSGLTELPLITADSELLHKLFTQLLINAIKYTPDGGHITVVGQTAVYNNTPGIQISITDSGIGIDPQYHELIFSKFYQTGKVSLHSSSKTKFKGGGPGLGLAIARGIVQAHKGHIWAESAGHDEEALPGSTFHVFLPS